VKTTLVDSNVLLDYLTEHDQWFGWSAAMLARAGDAGDVAINPIIYAEVSARYERIEDVDAQLSPEYFLRLALPWEAAFVAGKVYLAYRKRGGTKQAPLPDFLIGAHAAVSGLTLLTRDPRRYRTYFPRLRLVSP
jgi:predicted nucleic acid-binding protein